jgi:leucyl-tRNA synthetase
MVNGEKMSKSKGNFTILREALRDHGISETRLALVNAGEGLDDANFEGDFARNCGRRLQKWLDESSGSRATRTTREAVDGWFESVFHQRLKEAKRAMSETMFRSALKVVLFDMQNDWAWYLRRCGNEPDQALAKAFADAQAKLMAPFAPHLSEELWERLGHKGFVINQAYPEADDSKIRPESQAAESFLIQAMGDVQEIIKITKMAPKTVLFYTCPGWKREALRVMRGVVEERGVVADPGTLIKACMAEGSLKAHAKELPRFAGQMHKSPETLRRGSGDGFDEFEVLQGARSFLEQSLGAKVEIYRADDPERRDPANKGANGNTGKPAIYLES